VAPPPIYAVVPFVLMLMAIAIWPLVAPAWWHANRHKLLVASCLACPVVVLYALHDPATLLHTCMEYLSFIIFLGALYAISGGIRLHGDLRATPRTNTIFLAVGSVLASWIGTTGASMLLIRPVLETNRERRFVTHTVIFFIFLVSNVSGLLSPLGDPPLFLGYLQGVPFGWPLTRLWPAWLVYVPLLLLVYFAWDGFAYRRETPEAREADRRRVEPLQIQGWGNALLLGLVVLAVAALPSPWRDGTIASAAALSILLTPRTIHRANAVTAYPIIEVAVLFFGIFFTMIPALELLRHHGATLGIQRPWHFFWATGILSSVLDNAPTYLVFLALGQGLGLSNEVVGVSEATLMAISLGAVAFGANTYIGNAPNFMVKAIAEHAGVRMPSFFGYILYSSAILLPVHLLVTLLFLRD